MTEYSSMSFKCPECNHTLDARIVEHRGGVNDYGWWIIKCQECAHVFSAYIGRDVNDSSMACGCTILDRLDKDVYSNDDVEQRVEALRK